jgi:predicted metal-binding membrane protein
MTDAAPETQRLTGRPSSTTAERVLAAARLDARGGLVAASVAGVAGACWVAASGRMAGMDMGPGGDLGSLPSFTATWATMMAAMMLPSALPAMLSVDRARSRPRGARAAPTVAFVVSYLAVWTAAGLAAFLAYREVRGAHLAFLAWDDVGRYVAGAAIAAAGVYELTALKRACLGRCRALGERAAGPAVRAGLRYGADCLGCCAGLMLVLFAVGVMSVFWMAVVGVLVFVEKVPPVGARSTAPVALLLAALGALVAFAPAAVPGLTLPM